MIKLRAGSYTPSQALLSSPASYSQPSNWLLYTLFLGLYSTTVLSIHLCSSKFFVFLGFTLLLTLVEYVVGVGSSYEGFSWGFYRYLPQSGHVREVIVKSRTGAHVFTLSRACITILGTPSVTLIVIGRRVSGYTYSFILARDTARRPGPEWNCTSITAASSTCLMLRLERGRRVEC